MYFSRYIWIFLRRIYIRYIIRQKRLKIEKFKTKILKFKKIKSHFSIKKLSKIPLTYIPLALKSSVSRSPRKQRDKRKLLKINLIKKLKLKQLLLIYNLNFKYKILYNFKYLFIHKFYLLIKRTRLKYKLFKKNRKLILHNGRMYFKYSMPKLNLTLSVLTETVKYGFRKQKKKKK